MRKYAPFFFCFFLVLLLAGCQSKEDTQKEQVETEQPPLLFLAVSDVLIKKFAAHSYDWTYETTTGQQKNIRQMDTLPPSKEVASMEEVKVKAFRYLKVGFDPMPIYYDVTLYDKEDREVARYESIEEIKERGSYVMKIDAQFKKGEALYYVPLHMMK